MTNTSQTDPESGRCCRTSLGLLAVVLLVGFVTLPARQYPGDPNAWREEARSLLVQGRLGVDPEIAGALGERGQFFVRNPRDGRWYSKYGIVNTLLNTVPLLAEYAVTGSLPPWDSPHRVLFLGLFFLLLAAAIAYLLYQVTGFYSDSSAARVTFVLLAFYTTYLWNYLRATNSESTQLLGFLLLYLSYLRFKRRGGPLATRPRRDLYVAWLALALLCQTRVSYLLFVPVFAAALAVLAWRERLPRSAWPSFAGHALVLPVVLLLAAQAGVHQLKFGSPLLSGYHQWWDRDNPHSIGDVLYDFLISWQWSFFVNFPLLLLALPGARRFFGRHPDESTFLFASFLLTFALVEPLPFWRGEYAYGPRYFVFILPLLALPALYPLKWAFARPNQPGRAALLTALLLCGAFLVFAQLQVHRLPFFFKYSIRPNLPGVKGGAVNDYFDTTSYAKINWDHIHCDNHWDRLPYYAELRRTQSPEALTIWEANLRRQLSQCNLYWFTDP